MAIVLGRVPPLPPTPHGDENVALHKELLQLCEMCWEFGPSSRPRMSDVTVLDIFHESQTRRLQTGQERGKGGQVVSLGGQVACRVLGAQRSPRIRSLLLRRATFSYRGTAINLSRPTARHW